MRVMSAGDGYRYLLASVAAGDGPRSLATPLLDYYAAQGTPPGYWLGGGVSGLGGEDHWVESGGVVEEEHLRRLLGEGTDPLTGAPLGLPYYRHKSVAERIAARVAQLDPELPRAAWTIAAEQIEAEEQARGTRRVVAGYDYTFSVPKSVSALWALADPAAQAWIVQAHRATVADVVALMEREVAATRVGHNGVAQVSVRGLVATCYEHYDSRAGDPQLHTHVVIANKVQGQDGKWRALDGRPMHAAVVALSEHYNALLADRLTRDLGVVWERRERGADRNAAWEITGVPERLLVEFSSRSSVIDAEKDRLINAYVAEHGHQPSTTTILRLRQQATLSTRPEKTLLSLGELIERWRGRATAVLKQDGPAWAVGLLSRGGGQALIRSGDLTGERVDVIGRAVVEQAQLKRSTWTRWNLYAEASRQTMSLRFATAGDREALIARITDSAEAASVRLTPPELSVALAAFTRADGSSVFRPRHANLYTSSALLAAEDRLLDLSRSTTGPALDRALTSHAAARDEQRRLLSADQQRVVWQIAASGRTLDLLVGPAGAGKTLTLGALRSAWERAYGSGSVIGLAPSAAAAEVLAGDLGIPAENTAKWAYEHTHGRWSLKAGQLAIVDEASLAGTLPLDQLAAHAARMGAKVLLAGDWAQLAAIDAGGTFGMLVRDRNNHPDGHPAPELSEVYRFQNSWEKDASLRLRQGDTNAIDLYQEHGRIIEGEHDEILDAAYQAWQADIANGRASILIAETRETVTALNNRARTDRVLAGRVSADGVGLHDGALAGQGDIIVTRRNDRRLTTGKGWVKNGDRWAVLHAHADGSLTVQRSGARGRRGRATLPAAYVAEHVELGYATTTHRAQGATVDTAHLLVHASSMTREAFYVAMTRGRQANTAYVATDEAHLEDHQHTPTLDDGQLRARSILHGVLQHQGAEPSAHETITTAQDTWASIAQLADQYETIAQAAQHDRFAATISSSGLDATQANEITNGESFGSLVAQLRRVEADGHQPDRMLAQALRAGGLNDAKDPAAVLAARLAKLTAARVGGTRPHGRPRYIAGLIPQAIGPMPTDMRRTLAGLAELIEKRTEALAAQAIENSERWTASLGPQPNDPARRADWQRQLRTIAAYRDRYHLTGSHPLGPPPMSQGQRFDHQRATLATQRVQAKARGNSAHQRLRDQQIDAYHGLRR